MENIELTKKDKKRIQKIALKLFPLYRYNKKTLYGNICFHHHGFDDRIFGFRNDGSDSDTYETAHFAIHWFEFCLLYLVPALVEYNDKKKKNKQLGLTVENIQISLLKDKEHIVSRLWLMYNCIVKNKSMWKSIN